MADCPLIKKQSNIGGAMAAKNISELNLDEFTRIQGPSQGSARDGSRVMVGRAGDRNSCVKIIDGKLQVTGSDEFRRTVEEAYEAKQTPSSGFGHSPTPSPKPEPEPTLSRLMPKTDTTSATKIRVPILVYQSPRKPGLKADGTPADDMIFGDMTAEEIRQIPTFMNTKMFDLNDPKQADPKNHFTDMRTMSSLLFASGDMKMVVLAMIAKFEKSEGGEFSHPTLTKTARAHPKTQALINSLTKQVQVHIQSLKGEINNEDVQAWMASYKEPIRLPAFNSRTNVLSSPTFPFPDAFGGLAMAVNDVWAGKAEIVSFERSGNRYRGKLRITLYDHFGLDVPDVGPDPVTGQAKPYGLLAGFRSWFVLQHYERFAYKPFTTVMIFDQAIGGDL